jgi:uracil-DNA glycosylase
MPTLLPSRSTKSSPLRPVGPSLGPAWDSLCEEIRSCTRCPLHRHRLQTVIYRGGASPKILFVGEAPGASEDRTGVPFVGTSGKRLDRAIERIGLQPEEFGVLNVVKCRPPGNRFSVLAASKCRPYLDRQLALLRPRVIVTLGTHALQAFDPESPPILEAAGIARRWKNLLLFPLVHPAAGLRSHRLRERWERDIKALGALLAQQSNETL